MVCPLCGRKLELRQINFDTAILICPELKCPYPIGNECIPIKRNLEDIDKERDVMILPEFKIETKSEIKSDANSPSNDSLVKKEEYEALSALESEIEKLSQSSQTEYNDEFNVMEIINGNLITGNNGNTEAVAENKVDIDFDMDEFLMNL